ncbi:phytanoyl-CoA dioxygenase family protein [Pseudoalteromonas sp. MMG013]|uniref:phytanoyl-CoA dioxygenase family protein n=1 Tax=Pseudoalteromonas sp. MMG013 TaxID=2822687 RepID=UPI001B38DA87|nr:phytanoyl-CoA dioxygenase family protein [Pseudoalteromonas sp. MMG013]MBQ4862181.1 phytanoyl-CoA dioxygenase family protein [Pseudoalteromonas sp. MMG013]
MSSDMNLARELYQSRGFWIAPKLLGQAQLATLHEAMDDVMDGFYDRGIEPIDTAGQSYDPRDTIRDINQVHLANQAIHDLVTSTDLAAMLAEVLGAKALQIWGTQLFHKPAALSRKCNIGWHQDYFFHKKYFEPESEIFTVWIAISDVLENSGPVQMVPGSHKWGFYDIQSSPKEYILEQLGKEQQALWQELPVLLPAGCFSVHHSLTFHGSYSNLSDIPRRSIAIRFRTEKSKPTSGSMVDLSDLQSYPIVLGIPEDFEF